MAEALEKTMSYKIEQWRRAGLQGTTILGAAMIALIWGATTLYLRSERQQDLQSAMLATSNLARVFEEHIARTIREADNTLIALRTLYTNNPQSFDLIDWPTNANHKNDSILHYSVIDAEGNLVELTRKPFEKLDLSTRDHFLFQKNASVDELFIGKPIKGIRNTQPTI